MNNSKNRITSTTWGVLSEVDGLMIHIPSWIAVDWKSVRGRRAYLMKNFVNVPISRKSDKNHRVRYGKTLC